jgi:hypothetical protein
MLLRNTVVVVNMAIHGRYPWPRFHLQAALQEDGHEVAEGGHGLQSPGGSSHHIIDAPILLTYVSYSDYNCHSDKEHKYPLCR